MFTTKDLNNIVTGTPDERIHKVMLYITTDKAGNIDSKKLAELLATMLNATKSEIRDWLAIEEPRIPQ